MVQLGKTCLLHHCRRSLLPNSFETCSPMVETLRMFHSSLEGLSMHRVVLAITFLRRACAGMPSMPFGNE